MYSDYDENKDSTPDEQTQAGTDDQISSDPQDTGVESADEVVELDKDLFPGTVELGEPLPAELEVLPRPDAVGVISLEPNAGFYVACDNPECPNYRKVEEVSAVATEPEVWCGPCGKKITDIAAI